MVADMRATRKRKCKESSEDISKLSLNDFMTSGFDSDASDDEVPQQKTTLSKAKRSKKEDVALAEKKLKKQEKKKNKKSLNGSSKPGKTPVAPAKSAGTKRKAAEEVEEESDDEGEPEDQEESDNEDIDDIEDVDSDDEVVAKPADKTVEDDDEGLDEIELSDEDEDEIADEDVEILTERKLAKFLEQLRKKPTTDGIEKLTQIFIGAVTEASGEQTKTKYSVRGQSLFNAVVVACLDDLMPAVHKVMKLPAPSVPKDAAKMIDPTKGHCWKKVKSPMILYMTHLMKLLDCMTQQNLTISLLRHILLLIPYIKTKPQVEKKMLKKLSKLWSTAEESVRVVAFLCLIRLIRSGDDATFQEILKNLYLNYVSHSKFTSPQTWPLISFMRRSLVEAYALRPNVAYQHSFLYIRQLAITLRTALTLKKKESHKSVYNWQFVHSILLWCQLLGTIRNKTMEPLIYPVVQVAIGALNLVKSEKFVPLRLHIIRGLIELSEETGTYIPILPMLVTTIKLVNWMKKPKVVSMKPMNLSCALRVSEKQTRESAFRDAVLDSFQEMSFVYLSSISNLLSFPEITIATVIELKKVKLFIVKHQSMIKQILEKIVENSKFIEKKREQAGFALKELEKIAAFELQLKGATPMSQFVDKFNKIRLEKRKAENEDIIENGSDDEKDKSGKRKKRIADGEGDEEDEVMDQAEDGDDAEEDDDEEEDENDGADPRGLGKLDSDLDTEEENDEEGDFEIADVDSDDD